MNITRHDDGSLTVPVTPGRHDHDDIEHADDTGDDVVADTHDSTGDDAGSRVIRPGEGGYVEALAEWEAEQHPERGEAVSTATGRAQAMATVHTVAEDRDHVAEAVDALDDPEAGGEALRHVLVGGTPSVAAFADEVADAEGGDLIPPHTTTSIIGEVLAEIDKRSE